MKKGWMFLLIIFTMIWFGGTCSAASWYFLWDETTTTVEIPLGANLQNYIHQPKANLYKDGVLLADANISYVTTGDWLYLLTDVDTSRVGDYQVWYKAVEKKYQPGQCQGYKTLVTFRVIDSEKPVFLKCPEEVTHYIGAELPLYEQMVLVKDNSGSVSLVIDDHAVQYEQAGQYPVTIEANDGYNVESRVIMVNVLDSVGPVITFLGENNTILVAQNEIPDLRPYFKAVDNIDGDVTSTIKYQTFDTTEERSFPLQVSFEDTQHNVSSIGITIEIRDNSVPVIELFEDSLILDYQEDVQQAVTANIKRALLGTENIASIVTVDWGQFRQEVGTYHIQYSYQHKGKNYSVPCELHLLSSNRPVILVQHAETIIGQKIQIKDYISVVDASDASISNHIEYDDSGVDYTKAGVYPVSIQVTNSSNLTAYETLYVTVKENNSPTGGISLVVWIPILMVLGILLLGGGIFIWLKKRRNCNHDKNTI